MTHTIKSLYNSGQRQFYMRGGGVSPPIEYDDENECFWNNGFKWFAPCGNVQMYDDDLDEWDLLPIPYTDPAKQLERVKAENADLKERLAMIKKYSNEFEKFITGKRIKLPFGSRLYTDLLSWKALSKAIGGE